MSVLPVYIVDLIGDVVAKVSTQLLSTLQVIDPNIQAVQYDYGHPLEIVETLRQKDEVEEFHKEKYPLIALFQDFEEDRTKDPDIYAGTRLNIIIANHTSVEYKSKDRYTYNFKPILYPIYLEFLKQLGDSGYFQIVGTKVPHTKIDRVYWGRQGLYNNSGNVFNDYLDCIEIKNLQLNINSKIC